MRWTKLAGIGMGWWLAWAGGEERPNVVVLLADDLGYAEVQAMKAGGKVATPALDRLAREGMTFVDGHSSSAVCTPSRYSLLTGRYAWRTKLQSGVLGGESPPLVEDGRLTVAGMLKEKGYRTACFGKWHLGMDWPKKEGGGGIDWSGELRGGPSDHGFDEFYGISASLDMAPYVWIEGRKATEAATVKRNWGRDGLAGENFRAEEVLGTIIDRTVGYLEAQAERAREGEPFFVYVPLTAPHTPILPGDEWRGKSGFGDYGDFVRQTDVEVGRVLEALDRLKLAESTLVVFTSDNGCSPAAGVAKLEEKGHRPSGPFRGYKADLYEGGHRVPLLVRWPGVAAAGSVAEQMVCQVDLMRTLAEAVGAELPAGAAEDSFSFLPVLKDAKAAPARDHLVSHSIDGSFAYREGDWKLLLAPGSGGWSAPRPGSPAEKGLPEFQLYHLKRDPGEKENLAAAEGKRVKAMREALEALVRRGRSAPGEGGRNDVPVRVVKARK